MLRIIGNHSNTDIYPMKIDCCHFSVYVEGKNYISFILICLFDAVYLLFFQFVSKIICLVVSLFCFMLFVKTEIQPHYSHVNTIVWLHHLDSNKTIGEKLERNNTRMLCAVLNKFWKQHLTQQQQYNHFYFPTPILQIIQVRGARYSRLCR